MLTLGAWYVSLLATLFVLVCLILILVVLVQRPTGGGLSGAFGGPGSSQAAFGAKTGDVLTWMTVGVFVLFLFLAMLLVWTITPYGDLGQQAPAAASQPASATPAGPAQATTTPPAAAPQAPAGATPSTEPSR